MRKILFSLTTILLSACVAQVEIRQRTLSNTLEEQVLENALVSCSILPEASGLLSRFDYRPGNRSLFAPMKVSVFRDDLLPSRIKTNASGARELLWGAEQFHNLSMAVIGSGKNGNKVWLEMEQPFFGGKLLTARKRVMLEAEATMLHNHFTLTSTSTQSEIVTLWCNLIGNLGTKQLAPVLMPVKGGVRTVIDRGGWSVKPKAVTSFDRDGVYLEEDSGSIDVYTAPGRPWIALFSHETAGVLVMRTTPEALSQDAQFYSYKRGVRTMEMIFSPVTLQPGESHAWDIDYIYFPSLTGVQDVVGCYGIDRRDSVAETILEIEACAPVPAGRLKLASGEECQLPSLRPGQVHTLHLPPMRPDKALAGTLPSGENFQLNGLLK